METSKLYTWAISTRVLNAQRATPCAQSAAFLHSEGTVTFDLTQSSAAVCLLHAQHPDAYRYVPQDRVDALLRQAAEARDRWTTQLIIHKSQPPADSVESVPGRPPTPRGRGHQRPHRPARRAARPPCERAQQH